MIPFPFIVNRFSFFVADHLLVGQLCTNPKSERSLLSCLKVTQCSMREIGDAPLYNYCSLPIQVMTATTIAWLSRITGTCPGCWKQSFRLRLWSLLWVMPWCNQVAGGRPWMWQQDSAPAHKSKETQTWLPKECYDFAPFSHWPPSSPTWTRWTTSFGHTSRTSPTWPPKHRSQPDRRHPPSIHRAPAGACGKGMLPVPDPYRGGDWGWRRLRWIDVSSTT